MNKRNLNLSLVFLKVVSLIGILLLSNQVVNAQVVINPQEVISSSGSSVWGSITGTLSNQVDLQNALDLKAPIDNPTFTGVLTTPEVLFRSGAANEAVSLSNTGAYEFTFGNPDDYILMRTGTAYVDWIVGNGMYIQDSDSSQGVYVADDEVSMYGDITSVLLNSSGMTLTSPRILSNTDPTATGVNHTGFDQRADIGHVFSGVVYGLRSTVDNTATQATTKINATASLAYSSGDVPTLVGENTAATLTSNAAANLAIATEAVISLQDTSSATSAYGYYFISSVAAGASITNLYSYFSHSVVGAATNPYFLWYNGGGGDCDEGGVYRVNHFGIMAYYNPCVTAYTPGAADFERIIIRWGDTGVFGTDNTAYIGVEAGGMGTNRALQLNGAGLIFESSLVTPASTGTRFLCIDTSGVVTSSASICVGT